MHALPLVTALALAAGSATAHGNFLDDDYADVLVRREQVQTHSPFADASGSQPLAAKSMSFGRGNFLANRGKDASGATPSATGQGSAAGGADASQKASLFQRTGSWLQGNANRGADGTRRAFSTPNGPTNALAKTTKTYDPDSQKLASIEHIPEPGQEQTSKKKKKINYLRQDRPFKLRSKDRAHDNLYRQTLAQDVKGGMGIKKAMAKGRRHDRRADQKWSFLNGLGFRRRRQISKLANQNEGDRERLSQLHKEEIQGLTGAKRAAMQNHHELEMDITNDQIRQGMGMSSARKKQWEAKFGKQTPDKTGRAASAPF